MGFSTILYILNSHSKTLMSLFLANSCIQYRPMRFKILLLVLWSLNLWRFSDSAYRALVVQFAFQYCAFEFWDFEVKTHCIVKYCLYWWWLFNVFYAQLLRILSILILFLLCNRIQLTYYSGYHRKCLSIKQDVFLLSYWEGTMNQKRWPCYIVDKDSGLNISLKELIESISSCIVHK